MSYLTVFSFYNSDHLLCLIQLIISVCVCFFPRAVTVVIFIQHTKFPLCGFSTPCSVIKHKLTGCIVKTKQAHNQTPVKRASPPLQNAVISATKTCGEKISILLFKEKRGNQWVRCWLLLHFSVSLSRHGHTDKHRKRCVGATKSQPKTATSEDCVCLQVCAALGHFIQVLRTHFTCQLKKKIAWDERRPFG